jgi:hypothetical protein
VRTLLEHVNSLCLQQQKRCGQRAAAIIAGDFNSAAGGWLDGRAAGCWGKAGCIL